MGILRILRICENYIHALAFSKLLKYNKYTSILFAGYPTILLQLPRGRVNSLLRGS